MDQDQQQFSAKFHQPFLGPITEAPLARVRDVVICVPDGAVDASSEEFMAHPPIATRVPLTGSSGEPFELGRGVVIDRLSGEDSALVMNACTPRGHYFSPIRQIGQRYSLVREVDLTEHEARPFQWDPDGVLWDALTLSRLIRDNPYSTEFAARISDHQDGMQTVVYTLASESKHVYRLRRDREWLDVPEGAELRDLLCTYWGVAKDLPDRVRRAIWRTEYASWLKWADLVVPTLISGLEALLKTERHNASCQFVRRVPALAEEVAVEGMDQALCDRLYDARSEWVHGAHVRLFASGQEAREEERAAGAAQGPQTEEQWNVFRDIVRLQDALRAAVRRCIQDDQFRETFTADDFIRGRWPA
jgi:hypothetical protein